MVQSQDQAVALADRPEYNVDDGGGGGMSEQLGERMAKIEAGFEVVRDDIATIKSEAKTSFRWIIGTVLAVAVAISGFIWNAVDAQGRHFQALIDANQKTSEARMDEFRRDSDRNYDLALKALERSIAAEARNKPTE